MRFSHPLLSRLIPTVMALAMAAPLPLMAVEEEGRLPLDELRTFADVYNQIRTGYVEEIDDSTLLEYAIQGMLMGLDPHSVYLTKDAFQDLQDNTSGEFSGLGLEVGMEDGYVKIISPIDGSPAAEAGLQSGDVILKLGGDWVTSVKQFAELSADLPAKRSVAVLVQRDKGPLFLAMRLPE